MDRRRYLQQLAALGASAALPWPTPVLAKEPVVIRLNLPGPHSLPFLPLELIEPLGIDRELGAILNLRYFASGVLAFEDMAAGNAPFVGHGFTILPGMRKRGKPGVAIASIAGSAAALAIIVRADLASKIKRVADLKFRSIGVSSGSVNSKTYLQWVGEYVLADHGMAANEVRWVQSAQNWESVRSVLTSKSADAVLCEEPFASRAVAAGLARFLYSAPEMTQSKRTIGRNHLRSVVSMAAGLTGHHEEAALLVRMLQRSLQWLAKARPHEVVAKLRFEHPAEGPELIKILQRYAGIFSPDGRLSKEGIAGSAALLQDMGMIEKAADLDPLIDDRWIGRST
jgi:NitT/TauT family transport system substrate-binding protein